ncbi:hypothetical protein GQ44DRAFT_709732 [Phaeosphaeriaceae sp. PMI808]|nr:hypothetical protein GQ44DRAFT_709732 [Phaeosphaeriaceae sp. PMI808]
MAGTALVSSTVAVVAIVALVVYSRRPFWLAVFVVFKVIGAVWWCSYWVWLAVCMIQGGRMTYDGPWEGEVVERSICRDGPL